MEALNALRAQYVGLRLKFTTIKNHYDGVAEIKTAGVLDDDVTDAGNRHGLLSDSRRLEEIIQKLNQVEIDLHLHLVGDVATREALDAVQVARNTLNKPLEIELTLGHVEIVRPSDIARVQSLDVQTNFSPHCFIGDAFGSAGKVNFCAERSLRSRIARQFVHAGAILLFQVRLSQLMKTSGLNARQYPGPRHRIWADSYTNELMPKTNCRPIV